MRTQRALGLWVCAAAAAAAGCAKKDPPWAVTPGDAVRGDPTVAGAPAPVGRFAAPPTLDGRLDEAVWASAVALGPMVDPGDGGDVPATHPVAGFARLGWDDEKLYFGFVVRDKAPVAPFPPGERDPHVWGRSSAVEIMLQPGDPGDNRDYYEIQVDTAGAIFDSHFDDYNAPITGVGDAKVFGHQDWRSEVQQAAHVEAGRFYSLEIALPWSSLVAGRTPIPPRNGDVWRLELYTFRDGQRQALAWSPIKRLGNFHRAVRFGRIVFR